MPTRWLWCHAYNPMTDATKQNCGTCTHWLMFEYKCEDHSIRVQEAQSEPHIDESHC